MYLFTFAGLWAAVAVLSLVGSILEGPPINSWTGIALHGPYLAVAIIFFAFGRRIRLIVDGPDVVSCMGWGRTRHTARADIVDVVVRWPGARTSDSSEPTAPIGRYGFTYLVTRSGASVMIPPPVGFIFGEERQRRLLAFKVQATLPPPPAWVPLNA
jgi:hypothetical protein